MPQGKNVDLAEALDKLRRVQDLAADVEKLDHQVNGNGQEGLRQKVEKILNELSRRNGMEEVTKEMEQRHHKQNTLRLNLIIAIVSLASLYLSFVKH